MRVCESHSLFACVVHSVLAVECETRGSSIRTARVYARWDAEPGLAVEHVDVRLPASVTAVAACEKRHARFLVATASQLAVFSVVRGWRVVVVWRRDDVAA